MRIISWNTNGLRSCITKGFMKFFYEIDSDIFCVQESKMQQDEFNLEVPNYYQYWNSALKKGYSGTMVFAKKQPISINKGIGNLSDDEGRIITLEYNNFYLVNCYAPHSQRELNRLEYKIKFQDIFLEYIKMLKSKKHVIICGDLNVAHREIDLKNPKGNIKNAGFTLQEREKMELLLNSGFVDTFRYLYPDRIGAYSWWSYRKGVREKNVGWRIDYCIVSQELKECIIDSNIYSKVYGSDHCPVGVDLKIEYN